VLPGKPCSYKPPRFVKNKRGNVYAGHNATIKPAREVLANQMQTPALRDVPLIALIEFYFKRPQSHYKKGQLRTNAPKYVVKTPDVDNCIKFVLDALQPKVITDDKIVTKVIAEKKWCDGALAECTTLELLVRRE
jgi:Holliday junction resolvase RusA-like endonuclease